MTDGYWRIKQYSPTTKTGFMVTSIPVTVKTIKWADGTTHETNSPNVQLVGDAFLTVRYEDGRTEHYPWASIVKAEYQPPTHEKRGT